MLPKLSQPLQQPQLEFPLDNNIKSKSKRMFVLFAKSVSVADATTPISKTNKISLEKFILNISSVPILFFKCQKTPKKSFGAFLLQFKIKIALKIYMKEQINMLRSFYV